MTNKARFQFDITLIPAHELEDMTFSELFGVSDGSFISRQSPEYLIKFVNESLSHYNLKLSNRLELFPKATPFENWGSARLSILAEAKSLLSSYMRNLK